jgi:hypothetical protein
MIDGLGTFWSNMGPLIVVCRLTNTGPWLLDGFASLSLKVGHLSSGKAIDRAARDIKNVKDGLDIGRESEIEI